MEIRYLPIPHLHILASSTTILDKIYEGFCFRHGKNRDVPLITIEKLRAAVDPRLPKPGMSIRVEILEQSKHSWF